MDRANPSEKVVPLPGRELVGPEACRLCGHIALAVHHLAPGLGKGRRILSWRPCSHCGAEQARVWVWWDTRTWPDLDACIRFDAAREELGLPSIDLTLQ